MLSPQEMKDEMNAQAEQAAARGMPDLAAQFRARAAQVDIDVANGQHSYMFWPELPPGSTGK